MSKKIGSTHTDTQVNQTADTHTEIKAKQTQFTHIGTYDNCMNSTHTGQKGNHTVTSQTTYTNTHASKINNSHTDKPANKQELTHSGEKTNQTAKTHTDTKVNHTEDTHTDTEGTHTEIKAKLTHSTHTDTNDNNKNDSHTGQKGNYKENKETTHSGEKTEITHTDTKVNHTEDTHTATEDTHTEIKVKLTLSTHTDTTDKNSIHTGQKGNYKENPQTTQFTCIDTQANKIKSSHTGKKDKFKNNTHTGLKENILTTSNRYSALTDNSTDPAFDFALDDPNLVEIPTEVEGTVIKNTDKTRNKKTKNQKKLNKLHKLKNITEEDRNKILDEIHSNKQTDTTNTDTESQTINPTEAPHINTDLTQHRINTEDTPHLNTELTPHTINNKDTAHPNKDPTPNQTNKDETPQQKNDTAQPKTKYMLDLLPQTQDSRQITFTQQDMINTQQHATIRQDNQGTSDHPTNTKHDTQDAEITTRMTRPTKTKNAHTGEKDKEWKIVKTTKPSHADTQAHHMTSTNRYRHQHQTPDHTTDTKHDPKDAHAQKQENTKKHLKPQQDSTNTHKQATTPNNTNYTSQDKQKDTTKLTDDAHAHKTKNTDHLLKHHQDATNSQTHTITSANTNCTTQDQQTDTTKCTDATHAQTPTSTKHCQNTNIQPTTIHNSIKHTQQQTGLSLTPTVTNTERLYATQIQETQTFTQEIKKQKQNSLIHTMGLHKTQNQTQTPDMPTTLKTNFTNIPHKNTTNQLRRTLLQTPTQQSTMNWDTITEEDKPPTTKTKEQTHSIINKAPYKFENKEKHTIHEQMTLEQIHQIVQNTPTQNLTYKDTQDMDKAIAEQIQEQETLLNQNIDFNILTQKQNTNNSKNNTTTTNTTYTKNKTNSQTQNENNDNNPRNKLTIIIDNIKDRQTKTNEEIEQQLKQDLNVTHNIQFDIKHLKKGGVILNIRTNHLLKDIAFQQKNKALNKNTYNTDYFGERLWVKPLSQHMPKTKWLCIPKINIDQDIKDIEDQIRNIDINMPTTDINIIALHRQMNGPYPTNLIKFTVDSDITYHALLNKTIQTKTTTTKISPYVDKTTIRCTHCQQIGHLAHTCPHRNAPHICVRCAGNCPMGKCQQTTRCCANCKQPHAASYKNCPLLKQHIHNNYQTNRQKTWADITAHNTTNLNNVHITHKQNIDKHEDQLQSFNETLTKAQDKFNTDITNLTHANNKLNNANNILHKQIQTLQDELNQLKTELHNNKNEQDTHNQTLDNFIDRETLINVLVGINSQQHNIKPEDQHKHITNIINNTITNRTKQDNTLHNAQNKTTPKHQPQHTSTPTLTPTQKTQNKETEQLSQNIKQNSKNQNV